MKFFKDLLQAFKELVFPNRCAGCGKIIPEGEGFCDFCFEMLPKTMLDKRCKVCGSLKDECQCKNHIFYFTATTAPYYNLGVARTAMYSFKFRKKPYYASIFARQMALSVKTDFYGVEFTGIVYVPMTLRRELKRGYNQSYELARCLSKILDVPLIENALGCNKKRIPQYKTNTRERFKNVKGLYYPNISLKGQRLLLVDDIKTTGATLSECSRSLLKAGAKEVYCVTGLIAKRKKKKRKKVG